MSDNLPFYVASGGASKEEAYAHINGHINKEIISVNALSFCMIEMMAHREIDNSTIEDNINYMLPGLVKNTQNNFRNMLSGPKYNGLTLREKIDADKYLWPDHLLNTLLFNHGIAEDQFPVANFPKAIGDDLKTDALYEALLALKKVLHKTLLTNYNFSAQEVPEDRIVGAVELIKNKEDPERHAPFGVRFAAALDATPPNTYYDYLDVSQLN
jgi:hypothetical protein